MSSSILRKSLQLFEEDQPKGKGNDFTQLLTAHSTMGIESYLNFKFHDKVCVSDTYECCFSMSDKSKGRRSKAVDDSSKRGIRKRRKRTADHVGKPKSSLSKESALGNN